MSDFTLSCDTTCGMQVLDNGGVEFTNEGSGARLRVFAALKHRFLKQVGLSLKFGVFSSCPQQYLVGALQMCAWTVICCDIVLYARYHSNGVQ